MTQVYRGKSPLPHPGPYLGVVTNHLDVTQMGMIEVALIKGMPEDREFQGTTYPVRYLSPFYGVTNVKWEGNNSTSFNDVQKSYGMWMVPPDIGTQVLVIFVSGDPNQGYWIGCVMDQYQNHMVPGIAASKNTAMTSEQLEKYKTSYLPVGEFLKSVNQGSLGPSVDKIAKPVHPFAERLLEQGLLLDTVRGVTSSSARREIPSMVFGISTPGPLDKEGPKKPIGYGAGKLAPVSRLGGSTFVMDDGDIDGQNELVRIRTRTGHQVLLHNTKDLIYIANSKGTAWIELTSNGKIDIYTADSISIHSEQDLNFRADRNVNIEAGGKFNISSTDFHVEASRKFEVLSQNDVAFDANNISLSARSSIDLKSSGILNIESIDDFNIKSSAELKIGSDGNLHISSSADTFQTSTNFNLKALADGFITAVGQLHTNGIPAKESEFPIPSQPLSIDPLPIFVLPNRSAAGSWENDFYRIDDLFTIMTRVPTHEPYEQHESINPEQFSAVALDPEVVESTLVDKDTILAAVSNAGIIGDSIAVGVGQRRPQAYLKAVVGISSKKWNDTYLEEVKTRAFDRLVISLGSNDSNPSVVKTQLTKLRNEITAQQVVWILPANNSKIADVINELANSKGDNATTIPKLSSDGVHPTTLGYNELANIVLPLPAASSGVGTAPISKKVSNVVNNTYRRPPVLRGTPPPPTGDFEQDNLQAFLWTIRWAEGTDTSNGYQARYPSTTFDVDNPTLSNGKANPAYKFKDHPNIVGSATIKGRVVRSTASGAYQFLYSTWNDCKRACNLPDFSPASQDKAAIYLISRRGALEYVKKGQFNIAIEKCRQEWASFPKAGYDQVERSLAQLTQIYKSAGGKFA